MKAGTDNPLLDRMFNDNREAPCRTIALRLAMLQKLAPLKETLQSLTL